MDKGTKDAINYLINRFDELETDLEKEREKVKLIRTKFPKKRKISIFNRLIVYLQYAYQNK